MNNFYIDIHIIQTVPPSCINRDDTGSPKTAVYGGKMCIRDRYKDIRRVRYDCYAE